jgi:hypothetical protein
MKPKKGGSEEERGGVISKFHPAFCFYLTTVA